MFKIKEIHLKNYLPKVIKTFGHAYLHGDGNIYVDKRDEDGHLIQKEHQPSYLAKHFAADSNEAAKYVLYLSSVDQIPATVEECEKAFMAARSKEQIEKYQIKSANDFLSIPEDEPEIEGKVKKGGRPPKEKSENNE